MHADQAFYNEMGVKVGQLVNSRGLGVKVESIKETQKSNYVDQEFQVRLFTKKFGDILLHPHRRYYPVSDQVMNKTAITHDLLTDIYVNIGDMIADGMWAMRVYIKPGVILLWVGAFFMIIGFAYASRRMRK